VTGVFLRDIPVELKNMGIESLTMSISMESNLDAIILTLKDMPKLRQLGLHGSVIDKKSFKRLENALPNVSVTHPTMQ
jgi:hypothetical protein